MADDEVISLSDWKAAKSSPTRGMEEVGDLEGYQVSWGKNGDVLIAVVTPGAEYAAVLPRDVARRLGMRICIAAERARRCQRSTNSGE